MIPIFEPSLTDLERRNLMNAFDTGWISSQGGYINEFENAFSKYHNTKYAISCSNCTTALHLALLALEIGNGDEVICPDLTFIAPANMIALTGAMPVLVDVEPVSWCIDPKKIEEKITTKTKAIIVVHAFGHAANMEAIGRIAEKYKLPIIEDVAEAPGALFKGKLVGTFGDLSCYSFFANKIITTGEGGMILAKSENVDIRLRTLRDHGMSRAKKYVHEIVGFNYRMTNMQAAIGIAQLERFEDILSIRNNQAEIYKKNFEGAKKIHWRPTEPWCNEVHWLSTISLENAELRDPLLNYLHSRGIDARQMVYPVHMAKPYALDKDRQDLAVSTNVSLSSLHLPSSTGLDILTIKNICEIVVNWIERNDR